MVESTLATDMSITTDVFLQGDLSNGLDFFSTKNKIFVHEVCPANTATGRQMAMFVQNTATEVLEGFSNP